MNPDSLKTNSDPLHCASILFLQILIVNLPVLIISIIFKLRLILIELFSLSTSTLFTCKKLEKLQSGELEHVKFHVLQTSNFQANIIIFLLQANSLEDPVRWIIL